MAQSVDAYKEGYDAFKQRMAPGNCPYLLREAPDVRLAQHWLDGWYSGMLEQQANAKEYINNYLEATFPE